MKDYLFKRPMLLCGIICILISVLCYYSKFWLILFGVLITVSLIFIIVSKKNYQHIVGLILAFIMLLSTGLTLAEISAVQKLDNTECNAILTVNSVERESGEYSIATVIVQESDTIKKGSRLRVYCNEPKLEIGQAIKADLKLKRLEENTYKKGNISEEIYLTANTKNITFINNREDFVLTNVGKTRKFIKETLFSNMGYNEAATISALVFGDKSFFTKEYYNNVKKSGVSHVMVVSGMHLSILVMLFTFLCEKYVYNRYIKALIIILVVILLTAVCGFTMSIMRSGITYIVMAFSLIFKRQSTAANSLRAAVAIILVFSPFATFSVAFQLSILSTFGILAVAIPITDYISQKRLIKSKSLTGAVSLLITTISAMVLTMPVLIYVFGEISVVSVITNLLISYAVTFALSLAIIGVILNLFSPSFATIVLAFCKIITKYINWVINVFASLPFSVVDLPKWTSFLSIIIIFIIFWILLACKNRFDMIKLNKMSEKIKKEGGKRLKWQ